MAFKRIIPFLPRLLPAAICLFVLIGPSLSAKDSITTTLSFKTEDLEFSRRPAEDHITYDLVLFENCDVNLASPGAPMVPAKLFKLALPSGFDLSGIRVKALNTREVDGTFLLHPVQKAVPSSKPEAFSFTPPDAAWYKGDHPFPESDATLIGQGSLSGYAIVDVAIYPVKWNPADGKLYLSDMEVTLDLIPSQAAPKVKRRTPHGEKVFRNAVKNLVINPARVPDAAAANVVHPTGGRDDVVEYLIITKSEYVSAFQQLADWKKKKGLPSEVVSTDWIYASYGTALDDEADKIRLCIKDYWQNKGLIYVLLAGDTASTLPPVPDRRAFVMSADKGNAIPCDLFFADLDGTWDDDGDGIYGELGDDNIDMYCDVYVSRASVDNTDQVSRFLTKVLQYEGESSQPPLNTAYLTKMLFLGSVLDFLADGKSLKNKIDSESVPARFDPITKLYESNGNLTPASAITEINAGQNFINHSGHGNNNTIQAGATYITNTHINTITNGPDYSIFYSHSCFSGNFVWSTGECLGEKFCNAANGGGFYIGNSRYGWHSIPFEYQLSPKLDREFYKSIFDTDEYYYPLGQIHAEAKHKRVGVAKLINHERYIQYELNLLGDPEMPVWKDTPKDLTVVHPASLPTGPSSFTVNVKSSGAWITGARVCLMKDNDLYAVKETDYIGNAQFSISPVSGGSLHVTVWEGDHYVYEGTASVTGGPLSADTDTLSESTGGLVNFYLDAEAANAGRSYLLLGGMSGTTPGTPFPGGYIVLPLNWDFMTGVVIDMLNGPVFSNFMGTLDGGGQGTAQFNTYGPMPSGLAGFTFSFAYALNAPWDFASNSVDIAITP